MATSSSMTEDVVQTWPSIEMLCKGHSMKQHFPKFWSSIQKYYNSRAPQKPIPKLSPHDLHLKWTMASHKYKELSSIIMKFAPSVVAVSVFSGVKRYLDCSGYIIDWDDSNKIATILTTAKVMRFPGERDDYYIAIRLANGKILLAEEDYVDYYNNIVTLKVRSDATLKPVERKLYNIETLHQGVVVALGREFYTYKLLESSGLARTDHPYFGSDLLVSSTCSGSEVLEGGPLITLEGYGCGINFFDGSKFVHPLLTAVIYHYLDKWNSSRIVMRPWFGLGVIDIAQLPHGVLEKVAGVCSDSTAVVREVYKGSPADKVGVHPGERVTALMRSWKEITVDSASEYDRLLSNISSKLSACCLNNAPEILISVLGFYPHICKVVHAEILRINDKKFCCSWVVDESDDPDWDLAPRVGSQREAAHEIYGVHESVLKQALDMILE